MNRSRKSPNIVVVTTKLIFYFIASILVFWNAYRFYVFIRDYHVFSVGNNTLQQEDASATGVENNNATLPLNVQVNQFKRSTIRVPTYPKYLSGPDFIVAGVPWSNTNHLWKVLATHSSIHIERQQDINFWINQSQRRLGVSAYEKTNFEQRNFNANQIWGDVSPMTCFCLETPYVIHSTYRHIKIVWTFTHPVERAVLHYIDCLKSNQAPKLRSFDDEIEKQIRYIRNCDVIYQNKSIEARFSSCYTDQGALCNWSPDTRADCKNIVAFGFYKYITSAWKNIFSKEQMLSLLYEQVENDVASTAEEVLYFLHKNVYVPPSQLQVWSEKIRPKGERKIPKQVLQRGIDLLYDFYTENKIVLYDSYETGLH